MLPDINVWLALTVDSHIHHPTAKVWFDQLADVIYFCRMTQQGFLRLRWIFPCYNGHCLSVGPSLIPGRSRQHFGCWTVVSAGGLFRARRD